MEREINRRENHSKNIVSDLRILMKSCSYCDQCSPGILRNRIILGLFQGDTREELLKERKLTLEKTIDICKAMESAATHRTTLQTDSLNRISSKHTTKSKSDEVRECKFCPHKHPMIKERCPAWGKRCSKCGRKNHHHSKCLSTTANPCSSISKPIRFGFSKLQNMEENDNKAYESSDSYERNMNAIEGSDAYNWMDNINAVCRKSVNCKLLVSGSEVSFLLDTGSSINALPRKYATCKLQPYVGSIKMWNQTEAQPLGTCQMTVKNPKTGGQYTVPFVVFEGNLKPVLGYETCLKLDKVSINSEHFEVAAIFCEGTRVGLY